MYTFIVSSAIFVFGYCPPICFLSTRTRHVDQCKTRIVRSSLNPEQFLFFQFLSNAKMPVRKNTSATERYNNFCLARLLPIALKSISEKIEKNIRTQSLSLKEASRKAQLFCSFTGLVCKLNSTWSTEKRFRNDLIFFSFARKSFFSYWK